MLLQELEHRLFVICGEWDRVNPVVEVIHRNEDVFVLLRGTGINLIDNIKSLLLERYVIWT